MPKIRRIRTRKVSDWRIFNTNRKSKLSQIGNHKIPLPTCETSKYISLSIPLKGKLRGFYKDNFKGSMLNRIIQLMKTIRENAKKSCNVYDPQVDIVRRIHEIIPQEFFGCAYHRKLFFRIVKKILTRSVHECILIRSVVRSYDFERIPWLKGFDQRKQISYLYFPLAWVLKVVKYVIRKNYYFLKSSYPYEIQLIPHNVWSRFKQRVLNKVVLKKYAIPIDVPPRQVKGVVHLIPKDDLNKLKFRPILRLHREWCKSNIKRSYDKIINNHARKLSKTKTGNFYVLWEKYLKVVGQKQVFCVKVDVSDAYGRVNISTLVGIINTMNTSHSIKQDLIKHVTEQYVTFRDPNHPKTQVYKWTHGLLQGDKLSGAFCNLYMSYLDSTYLSELYNRNHLIHRTVDDYLFVSTDPQEVKNFLKKMRKAHILKQSKITSNVFLSDCLRMEKIHYCGLIVDTSTKEIAPHFNLRPNTSLHAKFRIWNIAVPVNHQNFITKAMRFHYNNYYFGKVFLNLNYNTEKTVLDNYFKAMVNLAFKYNVAVSAIYNSKEITMYGEVVGELVTQYAVKALRTIKKHSPRNECVKITFAVLVKIGYCAFYIVLRKKCIYKSIVEAIKKMNNNIYVKKPFNIRRYLKLPKSFIKIRMGRKINIIYK